MVLLLLLSAFSYTPCRGQAATGDSLRTLLDDSPADTTQVNRSNDLVFALILEVFKGLSPTDTLEQALQLTREARRLSQKLGYDQGIINTLKNEGLIYYLKGDPEQAQKLYQKGVDLAEKTGNLEAQGRILINMGRLAEDDFYNDSLALEYYKQASRIASETGDAALSALSNRNIGFVLSSRSAKESLPYYRKALKDYQQLNDQRNVVDMYLNLGSGYFKLGQYQKAEDQLLRSLKTASKIDYRDTCKVLNELGVVAKASGNYNEALNYFNRCIDCAEINGDERGHSLALSNIGRFYSDYGQLDKALEHYLAVLEIDQELDNQDDITWDHAIIGETYRLMGDSTRALDYLQQAVALGEKYNTDELLLAYEKLGDFYEAQQNYRKTLDLRKKQLQKSLETGVTVGKADAYIDYGHTLYLLGRHGEALEFLQEGIDLLESTQTRDKLGKAYLRISEVHNQLGNYEAAYKYLSQSENLQDYQHTQNLTTQLNQFRASYEFEKIQKENARLETENANQKLARNAFIGSSLILVLLLTGLYLLYRYRRQQRELAFQKERSDELRRLDQLKDQFLANTSHELRTPLQGIIGLSESIYDHISDPKLREDLTMIISSGKRLNNLVNDILDFSKLKNSDVQLHQKPVSLHALADIVLKNLKPLASRKNLELINDIPPNLPPAHADENRLQQVLFNLLGNGIKFTPSGEVRLTGKVNRSPAGGEVLQVEVRDTGVGIAADRQEVIFEAFQQADDSATREYNGTGLGLSVSKSLVEIQGGRMWVESKPGEGASFFFTLPIAEEAVVVRSTPTPAPAETSNNLSAFEEAPSAPAVVLPARGSFHILVVDDEPVNQQVLRNHLTDANYSITQALNGERALQALDEQGPFHLVLLDIMMPRMSGYEVCEQIRRRFLPSELPVLMITAKDQIKDIVQGLSLGANDYLTKPFSKEELLARIRTQLDLHHIFKATGRFVPNEFLRSIGRSRITEVTRGDQTEQEVTVLFSDIRDYTGLAETMTPSENFRFVNALAGRLGPIIQQQQGFVNQYLGDALMAIFNENPADALRAAVEMQQSLHRYNQLRRSKNRRPIRIGIGMHTGPLIMGIIGDEERLDAATISDTVNTTSRIENLTKYFGTKILLSDDSLRQINHPDSFHLRYLGQVQMKGKMNPIGIYECFDGDTPEMIKKKIKHLDGFQKGLEHYLNRNFAEAVGCFQSINDKGPEDTTATYFLDKAARNITTDLSEDWTGIEKMDMK